MTNDKLNNDLESLTEVFRQAGAIDQEIWASSQIEEGINQLGRFSFLKAITSEWLKEDDVNWVDNQIEFNYSQPGDPLSQLPKALKEMLDKNVSRETIIDLIRVIQFNTLFHVCSTIDKSIEADTPVTNWTLYETDDDDNPNNVINGLHESLLEFDPSDKEMRPRENK
ncbi:MAG: hypothetical protein QM731_06355 [Chitinophagaceae bacterium]